MTAEEVKTMAAASGKRAWEAGPRHDAVLKALAVGKGSEPGHFLAEGLWLNSQAVEYGAEMAALFVCPEMIHKEEWVKAVGGMAAHGAETYIVSEKVMERLGDEKGDRGVVSILKLPRWTLADIPQAETSTVLVLDGLENPGNLGTLIRTAEGAGVAAVLICNRRTGLNNRVAVRASLLTLLTLPVLELEVGECMDFLAGRGYTVYLGKAEAAARYCDVAYDPKAAVVVGHEKYGVSAGWFDRPHVAIRIPMLGRVDSLNVAVAGGILLYEIGRSRGFTSGGC